jgi:hypothetical protein
VVKIPWGKGAAVPFWQRLSLLAKFLLLGGIFLLFANIAFVTDLINNGTLSIEFLIAQYIYSGLIAIGYVYAVNRNLLFLSFVVIVQVGFWFVPWSDYFALNTSHPMEYKLTINGVGILLTTVLSYILLISFITTEGSKSLRIKTEMELAGDLHTQLVPAIRAATADMDISGISIPADDVGGDLIHHENTPDGTLAYLADVSGHGIRSGMVMTMFKTALHYGFRTRTDPGKALDLARESLNTIPDKKIFITFAGIKCNSNQTIDWITAGHPPILHFRAKEKALIELLHKQLPLHATLVPAAVIAKSTSYGEGDYFVLYSDGIIESMNKKKEEFGLGRLIRSIAPLMETNMHPADIQQKVIDDMAAWGNRIDDQSLLVMRMKVT